MGINTGSMGVLFRVSCEIKGIMSRENREGQRWLFFTGKDI